MVFLKKNSFENGFEKKNKKRKTPLENKPKPSFPCFLPGPVSPPRPTPFQAAARPSSLLFLGSLITGAHTSACSFLPQRAYLSRTPPKKIRANQSRFGRDYLPHKTPIKPLSRPASLFASKSSKPCPIFLNREFRISPRLSQAPPPRAPPTPFQTEPRTQSTSR